MNFLPETLSRLISQLQSLPWIWEKSAQRFAFFLLKKNKDFLQSLWKSFADLKDNVKECEICSNLSDWPRCVICQNPNRKQDTICIIENPFDIIQIEKTWAFQWSYHVLHWVLSPIDGITPNDIRIDSLFKRIDNWEIKELILAINPTLEWEATSTYIYNKIKDRWIKITILARWLSIWWDLEYTDELTISRAFSARVPF